MNLDSLKLIQDCGFIHGIKPKETIRHTSGCTGGKRQILSLLLMPENAKGLGRTQLSAKTLLSMPTCDKWARELVRENRLELIITGKKYTYKAVK